MLQILVFHPAAERAVDDDVVDEHERQAHARDDGHPHEGELGARGAHERDGRADARLSMARVALIYIFVMAARASLYGSLANRFWFVNNMTIDARYFFANMPIR